MTKRKTSKENRRSKYKQILTITHHKGGAGGTTIAYGLALALITNKYKVLLVDIDPRSTLSQIICGKPIGELDKVFINRKSIVEAIQSSTVEGLDILPTNGSFHQTIRAITQEELENTGTAPSGASEILVNTDDLTDPFYARLNHILADEALDYDYILIDTGPGISLLLVSAMLASHKVVVVCEQHQYVRQRDYAILPIEQIMHRITKAYPDKASKSLGIVINRSRNQVRYPDHSLIGYISQDTALIGGWTQVQDKQDISQFPQLQTFKQIASQVFC
ncbi:MAG: ParA family protein [Chloroflexota bacterium]